MPVRHRFLTAATAFSFFLSGAMALLWVRSFWKFDSFTFEGGDHFSHAILELDSAAGLIGCDFYHDEIITKTCAYYGSGTISSRLGEEILRTYNLSNHWQKVFFWGRTSGAPLGDEYGEARITCPHWLLSLFALILPAIWLWRRRKKGVASKETVPSDESPK